MAPFYQPSGRVSPRFFLLAPMGVLGSLLLGVVYAAAIWFIPFIYLNLLIAIGAAVALAIMGNVLCFWGHVRSPLAGKTLLFVCLAVFYVSHWASWLDFVVNAGQTDSKWDVREVLSLMLQPQLMWQLMTEVNAQGVHTLFNVPLNGVFLWLIWLLEAVILLGLPLWAGLDQPSKPYNEETNTWIQKVATPPMMPAPASDSTEV